MKIEIYFPNQKDTVSRIFCYVKSVSFALKAAAKTSYLEKVLDFVMQKESLVLDAPNLNDDFYMNVLDWGSGNLIAVALGSALYTWNPSNRAIHKLLDVDSQCDYPTSLAWSGDARKIAVGHMCSDVQLWDAETSKLVRVASFSLIFFR